MLALFLYPVDSKYISVFAHDHPALAVHLHIWKERGVRDMLYYALVFFVIALLAAFLGFGGIAVAFAGIAKILFYLFIVLFVVSLVMHVGRRA